MPRTGTATSPLHPRRCPTWLFGYMTKMVRAISETIIHEFGRGELLKRLADHFFFQSLACVLASDWHSSGATTTVCGALKEGLKRTESELGFFIGGSKGRTSRKTPQEIEFFGQKYSFNSGPWSMPQRYPPKSTITPSKTAINFITIISSLPKKESGR